MSLSVQRGQHPFLRNDDTNIDIESKERAGQTLLNTNALQHSADKRAFVENADHFVMSWPSNRKSVELYKEEKEGYYILVKTSQGQYKVSQGDIKGLDLNRVTSQAIEVIQKACYVTLNATSDHSYKVIIHTRGVGGGGAQSRISHMWNLTDHVEEVQRQLDKNEDEVKNAREIVRRISDTLAPDKAPGGLNKDIALAEIDAKTRIQMNKDTREVERIEAEARRDRARGDLLVDQMRARGVHDPFRRDEVDSQDS